MHAIVFTLICTAAILPSTTSRPARKLQGQIVHLIITFKTLNTTLVCEEPFPLKNIGEQTGTYYFYASNFNCQHRVCVTANPFVCGRPNNTQIPLPRSRMTDRLGVSNRTSRRRGTLKRFSTVNNGPVGQSGARRPTQENRSETSDNRPKRVSLHVENTYRMRPSSEEKFSVTKMENLMSEILDNRLRDTTYDGETCSELSKELVCTIIAKTKEFQWQRYKLVAQVHVGQNDSQAIQVASRCIWDPSFDSYACVSYKNTSLFVVASCYGIYYE